MRACSRGLARQSSALLWLFFASAPATAQVGGAQLQQFRQEADAFNRQDPFANAYRAGHYNGYLAGVLDSLQGRSVCFKECICEIDKLVERQLTEHPEMADRAVVEWLLPLLEQKFPCK